MSLINDALKRASQTEKDRPTQASLSTPMEPVREPAPSKFKFIVAGGSVVIVMLVLAGWFLLQWFHQRRAHAAQPPPVAATTAAQRPANAPKGPQPNPTSQQRPPGSPAVSGQAAVNPAAVARTTAAGVPAPATAIRSAGIPSNAAVRAAAPPANPSNAATSTRPVAAVAPAPTPAIVNSVIQQAVPAQPPTPFPKLQVKGIFYNRSRPYVLINGETLGEGEHVLGVKVVKIQPDRVILELDGRFKQMVLGE